MSLLNNGGNNNGGNLKKTVGPEFLEELQPEDDDTVYLPEWMFEKLHIPVGGPICLIFDFEQIKAMTSPSTLEYKVASEVTFTITKNEKSKIR